MPSPATLTSPKPPSSAVWINCLWFSSLVFALLSASLGTLVKQWLRRYIAKDYSSARERTRLREHRYRGLILWLTPNIVASLPVLLRIALNLFFAGLIVLLHTLDGTVMAVAATGIGLWTLVYILTSILPSLYPDCPYASPEALAFSFLIHLVRSGLHQWRYFRWADRESACKQDTSLDRQALVTADRTFSDVFLERIVSQCTQDLPAQDVIVFITSCFRRRLRIPEKAIFVWGTKENHHWYFSRITRRASFAFLFIALDASERLLLSADSSATSQLGLRTTINFIGDILRYNHWNISGVMKHRLLVLFREVLELNSSAQAGTNQVIHSIISVLCTYRELGVHKLTFGQSAVCSELSLSH